MSNSNAQRIWVLALFLCKPSGKTAANQVPCLLGKIHRFPGNSLARNPAYITPVLKFHHISHLVFLH